MQKAHYVDFSSPYQCCTLATQYLELCIFFPDVHLWGKKRNHRCNQCEACGAWLPQSKWLKMRNERRVRTKHSLLCAQPAEIHLEHDTATLVVADKDTAQTWSRTKSSAPLFTDSNSFETWSFPSEPIQTQSDGWWQNT